MATAGVSSGTHADLEHLGHDPDLAAKIMKKRQEEMARRTKLLDPRTRQFGVNHAVLDEQVAQKRAAKATMMEEEAFLAASMATQEHVLQTIEAMKNETQRARQKDTIEYSMQHHHKGTRREYCLSDPKEYTSAYLTHPDDQLGPASMSKFQGEQIDANRKRQLQKETADALKRQMQEKKDREQAEKDFDRFHADKMAQANYMRAHCETATQREVRDDKVAEAEENQALAAARRMRAQAKAQRERDEAMQHAHSVANSDRMCERHDYKVGSNGKLLKNEYKRLTLEEEQDVYNTNAHLLLEKKAMRQARAAESARESQIAATCAAVLGNVEVERARQQRERQAKLVAENQALAAAKREKDIKEKIAHKAFEHIEVA
mmetsp:Transcript_109700/g.305192  ORF Transcript_109700/g.305192 Transcript_109700/m.305192 type:complete len:376 (+) Transcript_109700:1-1128(+)